MPLRNNHDNHQPVSFATLMELEKINDSTYRSLTRAFEPGAPFAAKNERARTFGGHVYAQACWAAAQTVRSGLVLHSVTGYFTLPGSSDLPFVYSVRQIRDGGSFCVRTVDVTQEDTRGICFTCTCSFKRPERTLLDVQKRTDIVKLYQRALGGKAPHEHQDAPSSEHKWFRDDPAYVKQAYPFPGLQSKKVDMHSYHQDQPPLDRKGLHYYSVIGDQAEQSADANLDACAHLYASDRNSIFTVSQILGLQESYSMLASLSYTFVFHNVNAGYISAVDAKNGESKWFLQEVWSDRAADGRVMHHSRIWDDEGRHLATTMQDGLLRLNFADDGELQRAEIQLDGMKPRL